jgi:uncharacterized protein YdeI (YjbR/CyaY-like superfamily)
MMMEPRYFDTRADFRNWLLENHTSCTELWVGYYKAGSGKKAMSYPESVDEAICFGWIDGVRHSVDPVSYCNRFTPRKANSNWSEVNIRKAEMLIRSGQMHPSGLEAFGRRKEEKSGVYSYENKPEALPDAYVEQFKTRPEAWAYFEASPPSYRRTIFYWILSPKQEITRRNRLEKLIAACSEKKRIYG